MKYREILKSKSRMRFVLILLGALAFALPQPYERAHAQVNCASIGSSSTTDADNDGLRDYDECKGLTKSINKNGIYITYPSCINTSLPREQCLHPDTKDLFVILVKATPTNIPQDALQYISRVVSEGGLAIAVHIIDSSQAGSDRQITLKPPHPYATQKAVRVTESLDVSAGGIDLGSANYGTPNSYDLATVYTERIKNYVNSVCAGASDPDQNCIDHDGVTVGRANLTKKYIKHTLAHEIGHMMALTTQNVADLGGHHFSPGSNLIMEQSVTYTTTTSNRTEITTVTFYISDDYANPADVQGFLLK